MASPRKRELRFWRTPRTDLTYGRLAAVEITNELVKRLGEKNVDAIILAGSCVKPMFSNRAGDVDMHIFLKRGCEIEKKGRIIGRVKDWARKRYGPPPLEFPDQPEYLDCVYGHPTDKQVGFFLHDIRAGRSYKILFAAKRSEAVQKIKKALKNITL